LSRDFLSKFEKYCQNYDFSMYPNATQIRSLAVSSFWIN